MEQRTIALSIDGPAIAKPEKIAESKKRKRLNLEHELADSEMEEYVKTKDDFNKKQNARNADSKSRVKSSVKKGALVTLLIAIVIFTEFLNGKGVPLPADHVRQIEFWDEQEKKNIPASKRKIWYTDLQGDVKLSPTVSVMKTSGTSAAVAVERKAAGSAQMSATHMGHDERHAIEGCAINLLLAHIKKILGDEAWAEWSFEPVFDGLQADLMARHTSFPEGMYVPIQIKSAQIEFGKQTNHNLKKDQYENWMYCIAIGIRNYVLVEPESVDDTDVPSAEIYEVWDMGVCANLNPSPAIAYGPVETAKRCFFMHDAKDYAKPEDFILQMIENIKNWGEEKMFTRHKILYDMEVVNKKITPKKIPEVLGLTELSKVLPGLKPPWRQNETVDSVWEDMGISNQTATMSNGDPNQRYFLLGVHKYDHFCHWVIASYGGDHNYKKVAVIPAAIVYRNGNKGFYWNESKPATMEHVKLFTLETQAEALCEYLRTKPDPPERIEEPEEDEDEDEDAEREES